jgi:probable HAF family extracellular repeat protein
MRRLALLGIALPLYGCSPSMITDLGTLGGPSTATDLNDAGVVVGFSTNAALLTRPFIWRAGTIAEISTPGTPSSADMAWGINGASQVVGRMGVPMSYAHAFAWSTGTATDLDAGGNESIAWGINETGDVAGQWSAAGPRSATHASIWSRGARRELRTIAGDASVGYAIGKHLEVVGSSTVAAGDLRFHAVLWDGDDVRDLGTLGGPNSAARAITSGRWPDAGFETTFIVGWSHAAGGSEHAFVWNRGAMHDLGTLPGDVRSGAQDVNGRGVIVGYSGDRGGVSRAVMWPARTTILDLNTLLPADSGWQLWTAYAINDRGQVAGMGMHRGRQRAFLLTLPR